MHASDPNHSHPTIIANKATETTSKGNVSLTTTKKKPKQTEAFEKVIIKTKVLK